MKTYNKDDASHLNLTSKGLIACLVALLLNTSFYVCIEQKALFSYSELPSSGPAQYDIFLVYIANTLQ